MTLAHRKIEGLGPDGGEIKLAVEIGSRNQGGVELMVRDHGGHDLWQLLDHDHVHRGKDGAEQGFEILGQVGGESWGHAKLEGDGLGVAEFGGGVFDELRVAHHAFGDLDHAAAAFGQLHATAEAQEQVRAQLAFEFLDLVGQGRLRHVAHHGGLAELALLRDGEDIFQIS